MNMFSNSGALGFYECGSDSGAIFFITWLQLRLQFVFTYYCIISTCLGVSQVEWKMKIYEVHKTKRIYQTYLGR